MHKRLICLLVVFSFQAYAFTFNSILHPFQKKHSRRGYDYTEASQILNDYCTKSPTDFGIQLRCSYPDNINSYKADASASVKCSQTTKGISEDYPDKIVLPPNFIKSLNLCQDADIYGPYTLYTVNVAESTDSMLVQSNRAVTIYDAVCKNKDKYSAAVYNKQQLDYNSETNTRFNQCINDISASKSSGTYILVFKILLGLAALSFILRFYPKYKDSLHKFLAKLRRK